MAGNQLQAKIKEASKVLSGKFSKREDISINIEEEMGLIEEQQLEAKSEERNSGMRYSIGEDASTHSKKEIGLKKVQQRRRVQESGAEDINTSSPPSEEKDDVIASRSQNNQLVNVMKGILDEITPSLSSKYCIYRVPKKIRQIKEEAYDPRIISFGPFHHGDIRLKSMEAFKMRYYKKLVQRKNTGVGLEKYIEFLKDQEESVRQCYSETIEMSSDEFLKMLMLDCCFIIELLLCFRYNEFRDEDHSLVTASRLWEDIHYDLKLLENQIPFFVLEGLYNLSMSSFTKIPLLNLVISFFNYLNDQEKTPDHINSIMHFTDLILIFHRPMSPWITDSKEIETTNTTTELDEAGVKFVMSSSKCLLNIKFSSSNGVLEIPRLYLHDNTECILRNMIALEVCHYPHDSYMIDYFAFMDFLVNTPKDVDLLVQSGIVKHLIGDSKQVASLCNNLCTNIVCHNYKFSSLSEELKAYCKIPKHKWRAALKREYFSTPWRSASTSAAIILLFLTFIQTICSLISVAKGN